MKQREKELSSHDPAALKGIYHFLLGHDKHLLNFPFFHAVLSYQFSASLQGSELYPLTWDFIDSNLLTIDSWSPLYCQSTSAGT